MQKGTPSSSDDENDDDNEELALAIEQSLAVAPLPAAAKADANAVRPPAPPSSSSSQSNKQKKKEKNKPIPDDIDEDTLLNQLAEQNKVFNKPFALVDQWMVALIISPISILETGGAAPISPGRKPHAEPRQGGEQAKAAGQDRRSTDCSASGYSREREGEREGEKFFSIIAIESREEAGAQLGRRKSRHQVAV